METPPPLSVLLVEDHAAVARLIQELLRDQPRLHLAWVETLAGALARLKEGAVDVVLLDLGLPDSQGLDTVARVVGAHPEIPVIVLTGHDDDALAMAALKAGAQDYLSKATIEPAMLARAVQYACERQRAALALQASEERFRQAMDATSDGLWDWDIPSGQVYYSPGYFRMLGYEPGVFPARLETWLDLMHPADRDRVVAANEACVRNDVAAVRVEFRMRARDGTWRWILGRGKAVQRGTGGRALKMIGTHVDITERKQVEEALTARTRQLEAVRTVTAEITRELDLSRLLRLLNQRAADLVGAVSGAVYLWDEVGGFLYPQVWLGYGDWMAAVRLKLGEGITGRAAAERQGLLINDYRTSPLAPPLFLERTGITATIAAPLLYRDRLIGALSLNNEGTERAFTAEDQQTLTLFAAHAAIAIENARLYGQVEEALRDLQGVQAELIRSEQLRGLGQMAAGIAHDVNNTLAAILGQAELLKLRTRAPDLLEGLTLVETAATDGAQVVRRLQEFARPRGASPLASCDLTAIVREAVEFTRPRWQAEPQRRGVTIATHLELTELPPILGNPPELREAMTNLIFNAVDAMPHGGALTVQGEAGPTEVTLRVRDTGIGMTPELQAKIFEPFFTTKGVGGAGLGLSVVYGILQRHGGRMEIASAPRQGTVITLTFQRAVPVERATQVDASPATATATQRLLVIDDEPLVRKTIAGLLRMVGHAVVEAEDGPAGLALLARASVDLVLTDLGMPGMNGWEVARSVKTARPDIPVVLLTGWREQAHGEPEGRQHVDVILGKPVRLAELRQAILDAVSRRVAAHPAQSREQAT